MISVVGHLILIALLATSFAVVVKKANLVAPDRIEILEIDLNSVKVSGDKTVLYNVGSAELEKTKREPESKEETEEEKEIKTPSLIEEADKGKNKEKSENKKVKDNLRAPKHKKTIVRVKREVVSLDRTLTISVVDALRVAMTRCWTIDTNRPGLENIRIVAHLSMRRNGTVRDVWFESATREQTDPVFAYVLGTIRNAIRVCQPFKMLPAGEFEKWRELQLTFYPTQGKVM